MIARILISVALVLSFLVSNMPPAGGEESINAYVTDQSYRQTSTKAD